MRRRKVSELLMNSLYLVVLMLVVLPTILDTQTVFAQEYSERFESIIILEETETIPTGEPLSDINCTLEYEIKAIISSAKRTTLELNQGLLAYITHNLIYDMWIRDNLGNQFTPIINETSIVTPFISNITIEPFFEYQITLHFKVTEKLHYLYNVFAWTYYLGLVPKPTVVIFKLPKDYEIFEYSMGGVESNNNEYKILRWDFTERTTANLVATFIPFTIDRIVKSIEITGDISRYADDTSIREKTKIIYQLSDEARIRNSITSIPVKIQFPVNATTFKIESVADGIGPCEILEDWPLFSTQDTHIGRYYVNSEKKLIWIYPHRSFEDQLQFEIEVTYIVPNIPIYEESGIEFWQPYRTHAGLRFDFPESNSWKIDLTGYFEVNLILPLNLEIVDYFPKENALPDKEDDREKLVYYYNAPESIPENKWVVMYDNIELRTFNNQQVTTIFLCAIPLAFLLIAYKFVSSKWSFTILEAILLLVFSSQLFLDIYRFVDLQPSIIFFKICFGIEIALIVLITGLSVFLFVKKQNNVKNNEKQPEPGSRYPENPFVD